MEKMLALTERIRSLSRVAVAFSGDAPSSLLVKMSMDALGRENVLAVFADTAFVCDSDRINANKLRQIYPIEILNLDILTPEICRNGADRCTACKRVYLSEIVRFAKERGFTEVFDGAVCESIPNIKQYEGIDVKHPLIECGIFLDDVKHFCLKKGVPLNFEVASACYAEMIDEGEEITADKLEKVREASNVLKELGFKEARVRWRANSLHVEFTDAEYERCGDELIKTLNNQLHSIAEIVTLSGGKQKN